MAHHTIKKGYTHLADRINQFPQGAPPTKLLFRILEMLVNEREAGLISLLPIKPFDARKASKIWKLNLTETRKILDHLANRAILVDMQYNGHTFYALPPPMAGFFEFSLMRVRNDIDQKVLSELFYQYMNVEEDLLKNYSAPVKQSLEERLFMSLCCLLILPYMYWIMNVLPK